MNKELTLNVLEERSSICKMDNNSPIPMWVLKNRNFYSITKTSDELSIISLEKLVPEDVKQEKGWRALKIDGNLDFSLVGIVSSITGILAEMEISVFVMSTYNTDYIFIKEENMSRALETLREYYKMEKV
ncbi:MAG: ACT domain-containing protein [Halanaerobiaceae bacterium]